MTFAVSSIKSGLFKVARTLQSTLQWPLIAIFTVLWIGVALLGPTIAVVELERAGVAVIENVTLTFCTAVTLVLGFTSLTHILDWYLD